VRVLLGKNEAGSARMIGIRAEPATTLNYALSAGFSAGACSHHMSTCNSLAAARIDTVTTRTISGAPLSRGQGFMRGNVVGRLIQSCIALNLMQSGWWTKIVVGLLLFAFILLHRIPVYLSARRAAGIAARGGAGVREQPA
jgi:simple sugar transport system permease protein